MWELTAVIIPPKFRTNFQAKKKRNKKQEGVEERRKDVLVEKNINIMVFYTIHMYSIPFVALQQDATNGNNKGIVEVLQQRIENKQER